jgi:hypothetical protein
MKELPKDKRLSYSATTFYSLADIAVNPKVLRILSGVPSAAKAALCLEQLRRD